MLLGTVKFINSWGLINYVFVFEVLMSGLKIAQVGCGGMGLRHIYGQYELKQNKDIFDMVAVCDLNPSAAEHVASEAEKVLGKKPKVYTDFDRMISEETLDAVEIVTDVGIHHSLAIKALNAGLHVSVEKPLGLTVRASLRIIEAAKENDRVLVIQENHRRDPINRMVKYILDKKIIGSPRLIHFAALEGTKQIAHGTAWRQLKNRGGYLLDFGVHETDIFCYFMGEVSSVYGETELWEKKRSTASNPDWALSQYYSHRTKERIEQAEYVDCTSEDMCLGIIRFSSGAIGYYGRSLAAPGMRTDTNIVYCEEGSIELPDSRSGKGALITMNGSTKHLSESDLLNLIPEFQLDDLTASFFDGEKKLLSYDYEMAEKDRKFIAMGLMDFGNALLDGTTPEVGPKEGLDAVALVYAILESGFSGNRVQFEDVAQDRINEYQAEVNTASGL